MPTVLVTGGAGFIGSHLVDRLLKEGYQVTVFDNLSTGKKENLDLNNPNLDFHEVDITEFEKIEPLFKNFDLVFELSAVVGVERTLSNPMEVLKDIEGVKNILKLCEKNKVKKIIYTSSSEVYGQPVEFPEREDGHTNAKLPYAVVKLVGETFMKTFYETHKIPTVSLRLFNVYGPRQRDDFVVSAFIQGLIDKKPPILYGDGSQTRDYVYITDVINAIMLIAEKEECNGEVINIGKGTPINLDILARTIIKLFESEIEPEYGPERKYEIMHRFPDTTKMHKLVGYRCQVNLEEGLKKTIDWFKSKNS